MTLITYVPVPLHEDLCLLLACSLLCKLYLKLLIYDVLVFVVGFPFPQKLILISVFPGFKRCIDINYLDMNLPAGLKIHSPAFVIIIKNMSLKLNVSLQIR
jgi:hypothetical protein